MRKLKLFNGRWGVRNCSHIYIAANSKIDAVRMLCQFSNSGTEGTWLYELNLYYSKGCWGNAMNGIEPERGIWVQEENGRPTKRL